MAEASKRYINRHELLRKVGFSYPSIWKRMKAGTFPAPFIDGGKNLWDEAEVDEYVASLKRRSYGSTADLPINLSPSNPRRRRRRRVRLTKDEEGGR
jgi:predicted DNA-binding transcriptional regulator AlpA